MTTPQPHTTNPPSENPTAAHSPRVMLTVEQAADQLNISRTTTFALIKKGALGSVLIGRLRRVPADAIETYTNHLMTEQHPIEGN